MREKQLSVEAYNNEFDGGLQGEARGESSELRAENLKLTSVWVTLPLSLLCSLHMQKVFLLKLTPCLSSKGSLDESVLVFSASFPRPFFSLSLCLHST